MLDEIDKIGHDFRGDPAAALLEVLDPEQNNTFADHYLEIPFDLSNVMFVATANQLDPIPGRSATAWRSSRSPATRGTRSSPIARQHLVPKQLEEHGLTNEQLEITDEALDDIIDNYTREAGVRTLEREIASVIRGVAVKVAEGQAKEHEVIDRQRRRGVPRRREVRQRGRGAHRRAGRRDGPRVDERRRRDPLHRGDAACTARASCRSPVSSAT